MRHFSFFFLLFPRHWVWQGERFFVFDPLIRDGKAGKVQSSIQTIRQTFFHVVKHGPACKKNDVLLLRAATPVFNAIATTHEPGRATEQGNVTLNQESTTINATSPIVEKITPTYTGIAVFLRLLPKDLAGRCLRKHGYGACARSFNYLVQIARHSPNKSLYYGNRLYCCKSIYLVLPNIVRQRIGYH